MVITVCKFLSYYTHHFNDQSMAIIILLLITAWLKLGYSSTKVRDNTALMPSCSRIHLLFCRLVERNIGDLEDKARE